MMGWLGVLARTWMSAPRNIRVLNMARLARSVAQGLLATDFVLYLRSLGWNGAAIGSLLAAALVFSVCVTVAGSTASDRYGRKAFLLVYDGLHALACLIAALSTSTALLPGCAAVTGFGRVTNGTADPVGVSRKGLITQGTNARCDTGA